jgi:hypothetical protein
MQHNFVVILQQKKCNFSYVFAEMSFLFELNTPLQAEEVVQQAVEDLTGHV